MRIIKAGIAAIIAATGLATISPSAVAQEAETPPPEARQGQRPPRGPERPPDGVRPDRARQDQFARLAEALSLTDEQKAKIKPIMDAQREKLMALRQDQSLTPEQRREKREALRKETTDKVVALLTPEQKTKWEELEARRGERPPGRQRGEGRPEGQRPERN